MRKPILLTSAVALAALALAGCSNPVDDIADDIAEEQSQESTTEETPAEETDEEADEAGEESEADSAPVAKIPRLRAPSCPSATPQRCSGQTPTTASRT